MRYLFLFLSISVLLLEGCNENITSSNNEKNIYPLRLGNQWIYSQWLFSPGDTITIDNTSTLNGKIGYHFSGVWTYTFENFNLYYDNSKLYGFNTWDSVATELLDEVIFSKLCLQKQYLYQLGLFILINLLGVINIYILIGFQEGLVL